MPNSEPPVLHTSRLTLRPLRPADADDLYPHFADPETMRFMPTPPHGDVAETRRYLTAEMALPGARYWAICRHGAPTAVGIVHFLGATRIPGLGYLLARPYWGQGLTTEACRAALAYGFANLGHDRVELWIDETNAASLRVAAKLGGRLKGRLALKYPHRADHHIMLIYGLWAHEWEKAPAPARPARFFRAEPVLPALDVPTAVAYFVDVLGFKIDFLYGDPPEHAGVTRGDWTGSGVTLQISSWPPARGDIPRSTVYLVVDSRLDALHEQVAAQGAEITTPPTSHPWGMREFVVRTPDGHVLIVGTQG